LMTAVARGANGAGGCQVRLGSFNLKAERGDRRITGQTKITIRPERIRIEPHGSGGENRIPGMIERWDYLGNAVQLIVRLATGDAVHVHIQNNGEAIPFAQGAAVQVHLPPSALRVLADSDPGAGPASPET
jgi:spermidine/putrescine transport system ATP-binding protein